MPFVSVRDIPVIGPLLGIINLKKDAKEAFNKVISQGGAVDMREYGLFLKHALDNNYLTEVDLDENDRLALSYAITSPSTAGKFLHDVTAKVPAEITFGLAKGPQVELLPEQSTATSTVAGMIGAIPQALLAGRVGAAATIPKAVAKLAALGATTGTVRAAATGRPEEIPEQAATEAAIYAISGAVPGFLKKINLEKAGRKVAGEIGQKLHEASQARLTTLGALRQAAGLEKTMLENEIKEALKKLPELAKAAIKSHERVKPFTQTYRMVSPNVRPVGVATPEGVVSMPQVMTPEQAITPVPPKPPVPQTGYLPPAVESLALPERTTTGLQQDALLEAATRLREQLAQRFAEITERLRPRAEAMVRRNPKLWRDINAAIRRVAEQQGIPYEQLAKYANMSEQEWINELTRLYTEMTKPLTLGQRRANKDILTVLQALGLRR